MRGAEKILGGLMACPVVLIGTGAFAQTPSDVMVYPPAFFAEAAPATAYDMVVRLPGFTFERGQNVRGLAGSSGNVLIDARPPVSKNDTLEEILKRIPASAVARIELIRGGAPGIEMNGRPVVANVVRSAGAGFTGAVTAKSVLVYDGRILPGLQGEGRWRWGERSAELSLSLARDADDMMGDGARERRDAGGGLLRLSKLDGEAETRRAWATAAIESPFAGGQLRLNGAYKLNPYEGRMVDRSRLGGGTEIETSDSDDYQAEFGARHTMELASSIGIELTAFQQWKGSDTAAGFRGPGVARQFSLKRESAETVGQSRLSWRYSPSLDIEAGAEGAYNVLDTQTAFIENGLAIEVPAANVRVEEKRGELFAAATWRPRADWVLEGGLRQEASAILAQGDAAVEKTLHFTKPRFAAAWDRDPSTQLRLRLERTVDQLDFDDFAASSSVLNTGVVLAGNPDLTPEQAWVAEAALERRFWTSGAIIVTARRSKLSDVIDRAPVFNADGDPIADTAANIGDGRLDELSVSLTLPLERFRMTGGQLKAASTWRQSHVTDPATGAAREISGVAPVEWEVRFRQDLPRWNLTWGVDAFGEYRETAYRLNEIDTRIVSTWVTPFVEYKPRHDLILTIELQSATEGGSDRLREVFAGSRAQGARLYTERRSLSWGRTWEVRLRKTFGG